MGWGAGGRGATLSSQARRDLDPVGTGSVEAEMWRAEPPGPTQSCRRGVCRGTGGASPCLKMRQSMGRPEGVTHGSLENTRWLCQRCLLHISPYVSPGPRRLAQDPR